MTADDVQGVVAAPDQTRLFVRSRDGAFAPGTPRAFFCDGVLCDGFIWKYLWNDLAAWLPVTHWHYRGHGRSGVPVDRTRIDIAAHSEDLQAVRQAFGDPPCILVGHSMGCQVALECFHRHRANVKGLILLCGTYGNVTRTFHGTPLLDRVLPKLLDVVERSPELARAIWSRIPADIALKLALRAGEIDPARVHPEDMIPYLQHLTHVDLPMFLRMVRAAGEHSAEPYLAEVDVPTLVIAGERDTFTPSSLSRSMADAIDGAELMMVKNGTHVAAIEQPDLVNPRVVSFVRERVLAASSVP